MFLSPWGSFAEFPWWEDHLNKQTNFMGGSLHYTCSRHVVTWHVPTYIRVHIIDVQAYTGSPLKYMYNASHRSLGVQCVQWPQTMVPRSDFSGTELQKNDDKDPSRGFLKNRHPVHWCSFYTTHNSIQSTLISLATLSHSHTQCILFSCHHGHW